MNPQRKHARRSFLKSIGTAALAAPFVTSCLTARSHRTTLRHASVGTGGMAWSDLSVIAGCPGVEIVAICDVDMDRTREARQRFPNARVYQDWRELLDREAGNIDSVNVSTPDHMHAPIAVTAMRMGKHIYGQKPLAHELYEVRRMTDIARQEKVVTQMGIQVHSSIYYRMAVQMVREGVIGKIREVHSWCPKSWGDMSPRPDRMDPVPPRFNWDLWLGVCAERPFIGDGYYHPGNWRKRLDFGTGTLGDMGCHILDPVCGALGLAAPISVRSEGPAPNEWNWALNEKVLYQFAGTARTASDTLQLTWYDGTSRLPQEVADLLEGDDVPNAGSIFIGTEGVMVLPHISRLGLYPASKFQSVDFPKLAGKNHYGEFVEACLGRGRTSANFDYAGPLTETVLLGCVATRFPQTTLEWHAKKLEFSLAEANLFVRSEYRKGWSVNGLS